MIEDWPMGYRDGQEDALSWLRGTNRHNDDYPLAPVCEKWERAYSLWCLAHNVATACALGHAHEQGWWDGAGYRVKEEKPYAKRRHNTVTFTNGNRPGGRIRQVAAA